MLSFCVNKFCGCFLNRDESGKTPKWWKLNKQNIRGCWARTKIITGAPPGPPPLWVDAHVGEDELERMMSRSLSQLPLKPHLIMLVIPASSRRSIVTTKTRQTSVTRKKRSTSSTGSSAAAARLPGGGASSAGRGSDWRPTTTVDDGREAVRTGTTSDGWRRYARPGVGNVRHEPLCFRLDSVTPHNAGFLSTHSQQLI